MPLYNHTLTLSFNIVSQHPEGEDIKPSIIKDVILNEIGTLSNLEILDACLPPKNTSEIKSNSPYAAKWVIVYRYNISCIWTKNGWSYDRRNPPVVFPDQGTRLPENGVWVLYHEYGDVNL